MHLACSVAYQDDEHAIGKSRTAKNRRRLRDCRAMSVLFLEQSDLLLVQILGRIEPKMIPCVG
ncbi:MAG TPA: hypothetical protein VFP43_18970, partial [Mesorhizobium sp.]|nr:hypothetical protein [Mesorhizobium sp.]